VRYALHVDTTGGDIRGDEHASAAVAKGGESALPLRLRLVAVDGSRLDACACEMLDDAGRRRA
jgi:hypothetical protein